MKGFKIVENAKYFFALALAVVLAGAVFFAVAGADWGIDFTGGTVLTIDMGRAFDDAELIPALGAQGIDNPRITRLGEADHRSVAVIRCRETAEAGFGEALIADLRAEFPDAKIDGLEHVGAAAAKELAANAVLAVVLACILIMGYIWIRFELTASLAVIISLVYSMAAMFAVMVIARLQIGGMFIAAMLTVIGYSINNTIVIFGLLRENVKRHGQSMSNSALVDKSVRESLARTINTSLLILMTAAVLYIMGIEPLRELMLPLIIGMLAGIYSSILIAPPLWAIWHKNKNFKTKRV